MVDVDARLARQNRGFEEYPEMPAASRLFQCGLDPVILQLTLHLDEVFERRFVVGVNSHPFAPLRSRVDGIDADREFSGQVPPYGFEVSATGSPPSFGFGR